MVRSQMRTEVPTTAELGMPQVRSEIDPWGKVIATAGIKIK